MAPHRKLVIVRVSVGLVVGLTFWDFMDLLQPSVFRARYSNTPPSAQSLVLLLRGYARLTDIWSCPEVVNLYSA